MAKISLARLVFGAVAGCAMGAFIFWLIEEPTIWKWIVLGLVIGAILGQVWPACRSFALRFDLDEWRLEEVEIQGLKFTSGGVQRRVAWRLFVDISTRIAAQPIKDSDGDDGAALKSLYDLFQLTRTAISAMAPTPVASGDTIETYALDMLNSDLRPFLSKWHPRWEAHAKSGGSAATWPHHQEFRGELIAVQEAIRTRARGLALIAGVRNVERFFSSGTTATG